MYFDRRLFSLTSGVRWRIAVTAIVGLIVIPIAIWRLMLTGTTMARVFKGDGISDIAPALITIATLILLRSCLLFVKDQIAFGTAMRVKNRLRSMLYDHVLQLGPGHFDRQRTGDATLSLVEGVESLETFFGLYIPQLIISGLTPIIIFAFMAFLDIRTAAVFLVFALLTLIAPAMFHRMNREQQHGAPPRLRRPRLRLPRQHAGPADPQGLRPEQGARRQPRREGATRLPQHHVGARRQHRDRRRDPAGHLGRRCRRAGLGRHPRRCRHAWSCARCLSSCCSASRSSGPCATYGAVPPGHGRDRRRAGHLRHPRHAARGRQTPPSVATPVLAPTAGFENVTFAYRAGNRPAVRWTLVRAAARARRWASSAPAAPASRRCST